MKRPKIGDIIEIPTRSGFAYAQFTHKHNLYGALLRVYNTIYQTKYDFNEDGDYYISLICEDMAGNLSDIYSDHFIIDKTIKSIYLILIFVLHY